MGRRRGALVAALALTLVVSGGTWGYVATRDDTGPVAADRSTGRPDRADQPGLLDRLRGAAGDLVGGDPVPRAEPVSAGLAADQRVPAGRNWPAAKRVREVASKRTANGTVYQLSDGRLQAEIAGAPVHYRDSRGTYRPIDTRVRPTGRSGYVQGNVTNTFTSLFGDTTGDLVRFEKDGRSVALGLTGAARRVEPVVTGSTVAYPGLAGGADLVYDVSPTELKEKIVLRRAPAGPVSYTFSLDTAGLTAREEADGSIAFRDAAGATVLTMPAPFMIDDAAATSTKVTQKVTGDTITVSADAAWLADPARKYPVVVDPTIKVQPVPTDAQDVMISSGAPSTNYNSSYELRVGTDAGAAWRSLLRFDTSMVPAGTAIDDAQLQLYYDSSYYAYGQDVPMEARKITAAWSETTATWASASATAGTDPVGNIVTVDDGDGSTAASGTWTASANTTLIAKAVGGDYHVNNDAATGNTYTYLPTITEAGDYLVEVHYVGESDRASNAPYTVYYNGGSKTYTVDQTTPTADGAWKTLGVHPFAAGTGGRVVLGDVASKAVIADAVRFTKASTVKAAAKSSVWSSFPVRNVVQDWVNGGANNGLMVKAVNEADKGRGGAIFQASEYAYNNARRDANLPKLVITYGKPGVAVNPPTTITATGALLDWPAYTGTDIVEYQVHRSVYQTFTPSAATLVAPVAKGATSFQDTTAAPTPAAETDVMKRKFFYYMVAVKTTDGKVIAGPTVPAMLPKAGQITKIFRSGVTDTTLSAAQPTGNVNSYAGDPYVSPGNNSAVYGDTRGLVKFPISGVPANAQVTDAQLRMWNVGLYPGTDTDEYVDAYRLTRAFDQTKATWNTSDGSTAWTRAGGDFDSTVLSANNTFTNDPKWMTWDVTGAAKSWVATPATNYGVLLKQRDEAGATARAMLLSAEAAEPMLRPTLEVTYLEQTPESTYYAAQLPDGAPPATTFSTPVSISNPTPSTWKAADWQLSYKWSRADGEAVTGSTAVTALPADVPSGGTADLTATVTTPPSTTEGNKRTDYTISWELQNRTTGQTLSQTASIAPLAQTIAVVEPTSDQLGLEDFYSYSGKNTGAGGTLMNNLYAGNTVWQYNAFSNPGRGLNSFVRLSYNSLDTTDTVAGFGWSLQASSMMRLGSPLDFHPNPHPTRVTFTDGDGTSHWFTLDTATGTWVSPKGVHLYLQQKAGVECKPNTQEPQAWSLTRPDRTQFFYDCDGYLTSTVDKNGNTMTFTYEERKSNNAPTKFLRYVTDPESRQTITLDYWAKGDDFEYIDDTTWTRATGTKLSNPKIIDHVKTIKDIAGRTLYFTYTDKGLLGELIDGYGSTDGTPKTFSFQYDMTQGNKNVKLVKTIDPRGNATGLAYNYPATGDDPQWHWRTKSYTDRLGGLTQFGYTDPDGPQGTQVDTVVTDAENNKTGYHHDGYGRAYQVINAKNEVTGLAWDDQHNVTSLTEANGAVSTWRYDAKTGYPLETRDALAVKNDYPGTVLTYQMQLNGYVADLATKTSPEGRKYTFGYTTEGDLQTVTDPTGAVTTNVWDTWGRLLEAKDANGNSTWFDDFHPSGYPRVITDALKARTTFVYDPRGNVTELTNAKQAKTTQGYDTFGRPKDKVEPVDAAGGRYLTTKASAYDANDNIVTAYAANGTSTTSVYDKADQPTATVAPKDEAGDPERRTTYTYDKVGNVLTVTSPEGNVTAATGDHTTTTRYDSLYQAVEIRDAKGRRVTSDYDNVGNLVTIVDAKKNATADPADYTTKLEYDLLHRVVKTIDATGAFTTIRYDRDGLTVGTTDAAGNESLAAYNGRGDLVESKAPYTKDAAGAITYRTTKYEYDAAGNQTKVITPRGVASTDDADDFSQVTVYDVLNRAKEVWSAYDKDDNRYDKPEKTIYEYDTVGNLAKVSAPPSDGQTVRNETRYEYFDNGWQKSSTDPWGIVNTFDYNDLGQQTKNTLTSAGGSVTRTMTWSFYPSGNQKARSDDGVPVGKDVVLVDSSDSNNTASQGTWTSGAATGQYGYDVYTAPAGSGAAQYNWQLNIPRDGTYQVFAYYPQVSGAATDARFTVTHATGSTVKTVDQTTGAGTWVSLGSYTFAEDAAQKVTLTDQATGKVVADAIKLVRSNAGDTDNEKKEFTYRYNANGMMTEVKDLSPGAKIDTYRIAYDELNQIGKVEELAAGSVRNTTALTYDENGNPLTSTHDLTWSKIEYDARDMVAKVTNADSPAAGNQQISTFAYTARGELLKQVKPNGNTVDFEYYLDGSTRHQVEKTSGGTAVAEHTLEYGLNGTPSKDVLKLMNADNTSDYIDNTYTFDYDPQDRIAKLTKTGDSSATEEYVYDANSNVVAQTVGGVETRSRYDRNRLHSTTTAGVTSTYNYDPLGRLDTVSVGGQRAEKYYYDGFDRTAKTTAGTGTGAKSTTYVYDPFDRTVSQTADGKTTAFTYLGLDNQVLREELDGKADKSYQYAPWGQQLTQIKHKDDGTKEYSQYTYRPRGDVVAITKEDGKTRATYGYSAYGKNDDAQFTGEDKPGADGAAKQPYNAFRFNASRWDAGSGTYDMGFRNYDPGLNRFLTRDGYGGALADMGLTTDPFTNNRYAFAGGNPISFVELDGHLFGMSWSDLGHAALDVVGMVPVVGEVADVANGIWYLAEGHYVDAAFSLTSAIPLAGNVATAAKWGKRGVEAADKLNDARKAENVVEGAADARKAVDDVPVKAPDTPATPKAPDTPKVDKPVKCNSFVPGTRVLLAGGATKAIEDLEVGDQVLSTDVETGENQARPVTDVRSHAGVKKLVTVTVDADGRAGSKTGSFTSTAAHLFWLPDAGRWVEGAGLKPGMWLQTGSGIWVKITSIVKHTRTERVHNLTVDGQHDYYILAGDTSLLVHNCRNGVPCGCKSGDTVPYRPSHVGLENHHGILDVWAKHNIPNYKSRAAGSTTVALKKGEHDATKKVYRDWLEARTGKRVGGRVDWKKVSPQEIYELSERMFDAAGVAKPARDKYYAEFNRYIYGL
ncbi:DNRLRE domain-containing protein [Actinoplanes oblitus]|uniref:DNRLRE domain-containing protein n=1 Tax=Actinoplanes oblitus TaxID=3040509 RepID=A0ABY8WIY8_9ACTN|nr:DNRLRE domain-containing protein [Actinoplanes oblitus]WIM97628.1 DNRLRE domain-containing protein [Actinoplanes oblitus]